MRVDQARLPYAPAFLERWNRRREGGLRRFESGWLLGSLESVFGSLLLHRSLCDADSRAPCIRGSGVAVLLLLLIGGMEFRGDPVPDQLWSIFTAVGVIRR